MFRDDSVTVNHERRRIRSRQMGFGGDADVSSFGRWVSETISVRWVSETSDGYLLSNEGSKC